MRERVVAGSMVNEDGWEYRIVVQYHSNAVDIKIESTYICPEKMKKLHQDTISIYLPGTRIMNKLKLIFSNYKRDIHAHSKKKENTEKSRKKNKSHLPFNSHLRSFLAFEYL